ncbi:unnamed protein product [Blepharisma stoltei]|uniref:Bax inhibitor 1 n=1 Tax=Blepharisma stoltei TaxID=1481888 RepID=A0AAU9JFQ0_9CILI|nr:unnamed protein product [Blepharisma stoltei]
MSSSFFSYESYDAPNLFEFKDLSASTKRVLSKVYSNLALLAGSCALGALGNIFMHIGGQFTGFASLICLLCFLNADQKSIWRFPLLLLFGFLDGVSIGPLINLALHVDPSILITALFATFGIFVSFSLAALKADKRRFLYLGGILGTSTLFIMICSLLGMIGLASNFMFNVQLYLGLLVFCGYVIYDTQLIIYQIEIGNKDDLAHAMHLFVDLVAIFVRILIILMKNADKEKKDKK